MDNKPDMLDVEWDPAADFELRDVLDSLVPILVELLDVRVHLVEPHQLLFGRSFFLICVTKLAEFFDRRERARCASGGNRNQRDHCQGRQSDHQKA